MAKVIRWKKELEQYKTDLHHLQYALNVVSEEKTDEELKFLALRGALQAFIATVYRAGCVMNEYMQSLGQGRNKSLKNIFNKALKMNLIQHKRWLESEDDLNAACMVENLQDALKIEKKISRIYLPLLNRFVQDMEAKGQPTLFG